MKKELTEREQLIARADALCLEQKEARGWTPIKIELSGGKIEKGLKLGPYVATVETELRAREILRLRRAAADGRSA